jgi:hypothetical protein
MGVVCVCVHVHGVQNLCMGCMGYGVGERRGVGEVGDDVGKR